MKKFLFTALLMLLPFIGMGQNQPIAFHIAPIAYETKLGTEVLSSDTATFMQLNVCGIGTDSTCVTYNLFRDSTIGVFVHGGVRQVANEDMPPISETMNIAALNAIFGPMLSIVVNSQKINP